MESFNQLATKMEEENNKQVFNDARFWNPTIDAAGNGFSIIRFLDSPEGEELPYVKIFNHGFKVGNRWFIENCPTTIKQPCPVCESNTELWNSGIKDNENIARNRKRVIRYITNILILSDPKKPENEGKVFLFKIGPQIFEKLMSAIKPEFEDEVSFNPFDFWTGAPFKLKIRKVEGYRNYDKSEFGECSPLFNDDSDIERVWKSEYKLSEFIDPKEFKSYDELKSKFNSIIQVKNKANSEDVDLYSEEPTPLFKKSEVKKDDNDDTEDYEMYRKLLED